MDPTLLKKHTPKSSTTSNSTNKKPHPTPTDPIPVAPHHNSSIQNISNHFAKLYSNHKLLIASLKGSQQPNTTAHFIQEKGLKNNSLKGLDLDSSCIALTKSNSQHGRRRTIHVPAEASADLALGKEESNCTRTKVKEKDKDKYSVVNHTPTIKKKSLQEFNNEVKKSLSGKAQKEEKKNKEFCEGGRGKDLKKESGLLSKSLELDKFNEVGLCEMKRPSFSLAVNGGGGGRRKSFCCSQTELADFFSCSGVKVVAVDMPPFMQIHAVDCARKAHDSLEKFTSKTLAFTLKKEFDGIYGPAWHCIVGTSFGSFVTHSVGGFMYFSMDHKLYILLFKTTVQRAD